LQSGIIPKRPGQACDPTFWAANFANRFGGIEEIFFIIIPKFLFMADLTIFDAKRILC
jgi:hypothetical protein